MSFSPLSIYLNNKETVTIREASVEDAAALMAVKKTVIEHSTCMPYAIGEYQPDLQQEIALIRSFFNDENSLMLVAVFNGAVIGNIELKAGDKQFTNHTVALAIGILNEWHGVGLGKALMAIAMQWAVENPTLDFIWLELFEDNAPALSLYHKLGFELIGRKEKFIKREDGSYRNLLLMSRSI